MLRRKLLHFDKHLWALQETLKNNFDFFSKMVKNNLTEILDRV